jgi:hypothetical protein
VLAPGGCLVLAVLFSVLLPTLLAGRRGKARTKRRAARLMTAAGLHSAQRAPAGADDGDWLLAVAVGRARPSRHSADLFAGWWQLIAGLR